MKKSKRQLLREKCEKNYEIFQKEYMNNKKDLRTPEKLIYKKPSFEGQNVNNPSYFNLLDIKIKIDLNDITNKEILSLLDFHRKNNKKYKEQAYKLKLLNKLLNKNKKSENEILRLKKEFILINHLFDLGAIAMNKYEYEEILNRYNMNNEIKRKKFINEDIAVHMAYYLTFKEVYENKNFFLYDNEIHRCYLLLKYYYDLDSYVVKDDLIYFSIKKNIYNAIANKITNLKE